MIERPRDARGRFLPVDLEHEELDHLSPNEEGVGGVWLSPREMDVLEGLINGETTNQTASRLKILPASTNNARSSIYRKLQVSSPEDAIVVAAYLGLLDKKPALLSMARNNPAIVVRAGRARRSATQADHPGPARRSATQADHTVKNPSLLADRDRK